MQRYIPTTVTIPSGKCPFTLGGTDPDSVAMWIKKIHEWSPPGVTYSQEALCYWVRHTYDINGLDYKKAVDTLATVSGR